MQRPNLYLVLKDASNGDTYACLVADSKCRTVIETADEFMELHGLTDELQMWLGLFEPTQPNQDDVGWARLAKVEWLLEFVEGDWYVLGKDAT